MIKDNQERLNRMHVLLDILVTVVAYALAWFIVISGKVLPLDCLLYTSFIKHLPAVDGCPGAGREDAAGPVIFCG